jgi:hypothetical protein
MTELGGLTGVDVAGLAPPAWVSDWAGRVALPSNRTPLLSDW